MTHTKPEIEALQDAYAEAGRDFDRAQTAVRWLKEDRDADPRDTATLNRLAAARARLRECATSLDFARDAFLSLTDAERAVVSLREPIL